MWRYWALFSALSFAWIIPSSALAQAPPAWQLRFSAPVACSTEQDFRKALNDRASWSETSPRALNHRISVSILPTDGGWTGRVLVESGADGVRVERTAQAKHCPELVPALALMTALALDLEPAASQRASTPAATDGKSRSSSRALPVAAGVPSLPGAPSAASRTTAPSTAVPRLTEGELGFLLHWRSVMGWRDRVAVAPSLLWGSRAGEGFSPWVRVSGDYVASRIVDASGFGASLTWTLAQVDACTHKWAISGRAFLSPCVGLSLGALRAKGFAGVDAPHDLTRPWLTAGGGAEAAFPIVGPLWLRVQGGVEALVLRQRLYVRSDPEHTLAQMPAVLARLGLGLGVRIW
jgi:hypothetical protein